MRSNVPGFDRPSDDSPLRLFAEEQGGAVDASQEVLSIEDLAKQFNVSTKTISRWREHGLVAQRYEVGGRKRVGFLKSAVERFVASNPMRIERGARFSQLTPEEHERMFALQAELLQDWLEVPR